MYNHQRQANRNTQINSSMHPLRCGRSKNSIAKNKRAHQRQKKKWISTLPWILQRCKSSSGSTRGKPRSVRTELSAWRRPHHAAAARGPQQHESHLLLRPFFGRPAPPLPSAARSCATAPRAASRASAIRVHVHVERCWAREETRSGGDAARGGWGGSAPLRRWGEQRPQPPSVLRLWRKARLGTGKGP